MASLRIIGLILLAALAYGIAHDQVTVRLSLEYFTIVHPPLVPTRSPTLLAFGWGIAATWWLALPVGVLLAAAARLGARPKLTATDLRGPIGRLLVVMALGAILSGIIGALLASRGYVWLVPRLAELIAPDRHLRFLAALWAHNASYAIGLVGTLILAVGLWRRRGRHPHASLTAT